MIGQESFQPQTTKQLVNRFQSGETDTFDDLMNRYHEKVYQWAFRWTHDHEQAQDLTQETFLRAFLALPHFRGECAFSSWLYQITRNLGCDFQRKHARRTLILRDDFSQLAMTQHLYQPGRQNYSPEQILLAQEFQRQLESAIDNLPPMQQRYFRLRYEEGMLVREIATQEGRAEGTVKAQLFHAIRQIRTVLLEYLEA